MGTHKVPHSRNGMHHCTLGPIFTFSINLGHHFPRVNIAKPPHAVPYPSPVTGMYNTERIEIEEEEGRFPPPSRRPSVEAMSPSVIPINAKEPDAR